MRPGIISAVSAGIVASVAATIVFITPIHADIGSLMYDQTLTDNKQPSTPSNHTQNIAPTIWTTDQGLTENALLLLAQITRARNEGLDPERYHHSTLQSLIEQPWHRSLRQPFDSVLAAAFKQLVTDLGQGTVVPEQAQVAWFQPTRSVDADTAYRSLSLVGNSADSVLNQYRPQHALYSNLTTALIEYRGYAEDGGWADIDEGRLLKPAMLDARVPALRKRLAITGELPTTAADNESLEYDKHLIRAVRRFQQRHGLKADGIVGNKTIGALNVSAAERVAQIQLNLERLRWLPRDLGERYVMTNIADYRLQVMDQGREILDMPVVVGKQRFKTPVFSDEIEWLVFNPTWTVPKSIMYRELLPRERREPGYLQSKGFELIREENGTIVTREPDSLSPEEYAANPFRYTMRQKPGEGNALGETKFIFPNKYSVYLHDTPAKSLFDRTRRAFSHGCVRVGDPEALAETLLSFEGWTPRQVRRERARSHNSRIALKKNIPNHIVYLTSWVDKRGNVQFREDVYGHDASLREALTTPRKVLWPETILAELRS